MVELAGFWKDQEELSCGRQPGLDLVSLGGLAGYLEGDVHEEVARLGSEAVLAVDSLAREMGVVAEMENEGRAEEERAACGPWGNVFN